MILIATFVSIFFYITYIDFDRKVNIKFLILFFIGDTYFCDQKSLQVHHEIEHADIKMEQIDQKLEDNQELNCKLCGEFFYYYSDLKSHVDSAHKGTRCDECGKCFYKKANLNKHIRNVSSIFGISILSNFSRDVTFIISFHIF